MRHLFLTGADQVGKSTVITRCIEQLTVCPGGFQTYLSDNDSTVCRMLYMAAAGEQKIKNDDHLVALLPPSLSPIVYNHQFNALGKKYIEDSKSWAKLLVMDECSFLEKDALSFQQAIFDALGEHIPILGVCRPDKAPWTKAIVTHPNVAILSVTLQNREEIFQHVLAHLGSLIK